MEHGDEGGIFSVGELEEEEAREEELVVTCSDGVVCMCTNTFASISCLSRLHASTPRAASLPC